eukprot:6263076-Pyramimonas_sp.AAC.1
MRPPFGINGASDEQCVNAGARVFVMFWCVCACACARVFVRPSLVSLVSRRAPRAGRLSGPPPSAARGSAF